MYDFVQFTAIFFFVFFSIFVSYKNNKNVGVAIISTMIIVSIISSSSVIIKLLRG